MKKKILFGVSFLIGLLLVSYPFISSIVERQYQKDAVASYKKGTDEKNDTEIQQLLSDAQEYNDMLYQSNGAVVGGLSDGVLSEEHYNILLDVTGTGVMGALEIPKIDVDLPIYHGTSDEVLSKGAGHFFGSSLPVGGENTRTILTGHRGLPNSKLFTRLDELEEGDLFFIEICSQILAYKICEIQVMTPEEAQELAIEPGRDLSTLITCTPYGINSHRLVVTGERVSYDPVNYTSIKSELPSWREILFAFLPFAFTGIGLVILLSNRKGNRRERKYNGKFS